MKLILCPNKNETAPKYSCDLISESIVSGITRRNVEGVLAIDLFRGHGTISERLLDGEDVEIEIRERKNHD